MQTPSRTEFQHRGSQPPKTEQYAKLKLHEARSYQGQEASPYKLHLERLRDESELWTPPFEPSGEGEDALSDIDYLDLYPKVWGRKCGDNGIGHLREVAISIITAAENAVYDPRYPFHEDPAWLESQGLLQADVPRLEDEQAEYASLLEENGVKVHWIDWGEAPMSAFGPMQAQWAPADLWVLRGGSVIQKPGWHPFSFGRSEFLARWAQSNLGIPVLYTMTGTAVAEPSSTLWFAEDVWVTHVSCAMNEEGNRQLIPVVKRSTGLEDLEVHTVYLPGDSFLDRSTGLSGHLTNVLNGVDLDKALVYPPGLDAGTHQWLRRKGYKLIEVDQEEQVKYTPTNVLKLEAGVVFMVKEAKRTIAKARAMGVEVIEVPNKEFSQIGGAIQCRTLRVYREPGPFKNG